MRGRGDGDGDVLGAHGRARGALARDRGPGRNFVEDPLDPVFDQRLDHERRLERREQGVHDGPGRHKS